MATKEELRKLIRKGLTGKEASQIVLQDNWEVDHNREGLLSDKELSELKSSVRSTKEIEEYNRYLNLYRLVDYTLKDAHILALEAEKYLLRACRSVDRYLLKEIDEHKLEEDLQVYHSFIPDRVRTFKAIRAVIEDISRLVGVDFTEDLKRQYDDITATFILHNTLQIPPGMPRLPSLDSSRLSPSARSIRYYQERMAIAIGKDWVEALDIHEAEEKRRKILAVILQDLKNRNKRDTVKEVPNG